MIWWSSADCWIASWVCVGDPLLLMSMGRKKSRQTTLFVPHTVAPAPSKEDIERGVAIEGRSRGAYCPTRGPSNTTGPRGRARDRPRDRRRSQDQGQGLREHREASPPLGGRIRTIQPLLRPGDSGADVGTTGPKTPIGPRHRAGLAAPPRLTVHTTHQINGRYAVQLSSQTRHGSRSTLSLRTGTRGRARKPSGSSMGSHPAGRRRTQRPAPHRRG